MHCNNPVIVQLLLQPCTERDGGWDLSLKDLFQFIPVSQAFLKTVLLAWTHPAVQHVILVMQINSTQPFQLKVSVQLLIICEPQPLDEKVTCIAVLTKLLLSQM